MSIASILSPRSCALVLASSLTAAAAGAAPCLTLGFSPFIVVDQFGYTPAMRKVAVVRDPVAGFDATKHFAPGATYQVVDTETCKAVLTGKARAWRDGQIDDVSGDRAWHFDFTAVTAPGRYVVRDKENNAVSALFEIGTNPYRQVLIQAVRFFYYQRAGIAKDAAHAGANWVDAADHVGPGQDTEARAFMRKDDPATARDLHGGWWDAGDYSRYTNWHDDYLISLLHSYSENPTVFTDDFNIPESGNGIPDLIDEVKWGLDWLIRMQNPDGSVLSFLGESDGGSPPSSIKTPSYYGGPSTSATYSSAAAFAYGAKVLAQFPQLKSYAADLATRARRAYAWAEAHPKVKWSNTNPTGDGKSLGGGEQEVSDQELPLRAMMAAIYLYDLTGEAAYQNRLADLVLGSPLVQRWSVSSIDAPWLQPLLYYTSLKTARPDLVKTVHASFLGGFTSQAIYGGEKSVRSPYLAWLPAYWWGSNKEVSRQGFFFLNPRLDGMADAPADAADYAADYLHYLHGVNPLAKVYLSNMGAYGAANSVDEFFHAWFFKGTPWGNVRHSKFGPPPGYLVGGPNPGYNWADGCPRIDSRCGSAPPSPPFGQPPLKSYADIGDGWPIASWSVTEPSGGYQVEYIRLLTHFVTAK
jgi:endoglucanase